MKSGFYFIMAAQFLSALADNALLITAIAILRDMDAPPGYEPLLKTFFTISFVVLAAFVGAFADSMPKWRVMFISNGIKIAGCALLFFDVHPLAAYAVVGLGAAAYSPAKYGILTELLPHRMLVIANAWIEGLTVAAIIVGFALGGAIIDTDIARSLLSFDLPLIDTGVDTVAEMNLTVVGLLYLAAAIFNLYIPDTGVDHKPLRKSPAYLVHEFWHCLVLLWRDKLGQVTLGVTTLFWGAGATLQFIVIDWAQQALSVDLTVATWLLGIFAVGVALGAMLAARLINMRNTVKVLPVGIAMGLVVIAMIFVPELPEIHLFEHSVTLFGSPLFVSMGLRMSVALILLLIIGTLAGFFVVPMNALLQHRGHVLMGAGHSIAVQNFNENLSILIMTGVYSALIGASLPINWVILLFGLFVAGAMYGVKRRHEANQRKNDELSLLDDAAH